ncbi:hypothetical protein [Halopelagius fulvigenes]|uniref:Uncharacterized protein n=1 Tax=Halopelagius fulvigenes TaxID=1198324 RepID=A0ABD5TX96_9EURY
MPSAEDWDALNEDVQDNIRSVWFAHFMLERQKELLELKVDEWSRKIDEIEDPLDKFSGFGDEYSVDLSTPYMEQDVPLDANKTIFLYEATRIIHNYYATAYSLYDCANNVREQFDDEFKERYYSELYERKIPRRDEMIRRLRAYMTHKSPNRVFLSLTGWEEMTRVDDEYDIYHSFLIDRKPFRDYLKSDGRKTDYLDSIDAARHNPEKIDIVEVIREHHQLVTEFYFDWFIPAVADEAT